MEQRVEGWRMMMKTKRYGGIMTRKEEGKGGEVCV